MQLPADFVGEFLSVEFARLRRELKDQYPRVFVILGNDDPRAHEPEFLEADKRGLWTYAHNRRSEIGDFDVYGYSYVPPSPLLLKDWERYDVSRGVDPGCVSPEEGQYSVPVDASTKKWSTIENDLRELVSDADLAKSVFLFHTPPYKTKLDRDALDGRMIDHVPLDVHVGSIAVRRLIEQRQPWLTLHGHIHESARLTGAWRDQIGQTHALSAAHDGPELALIRFELSNPAGATRTLL
jgi:Icc-related predicted phosphoesterase